MKDRRKEDTEAKPEVTRLEIARKRFGEAIFDRVVKNAKNGR